MLTLETEIHSIILNDEILKGKIENYSIFTIYDNYNNANSFAELLVLHEYNDISSSKKEEIKQILNKIYKQMDESFIEAYHLKTENNFKHLFNPFLTGKESFLSLLTIFKKHFETLTTRTSIRNVLFFLEKCNFSYDILSLTTNQKFMLYNQLNHFLHLFYYIIETTTTDIYSEFFDFILFRCKEQMHFLKMHNISDLMKELKKSDELKTVYTYLTFITIPQESYKIDIVKKCESFPIYLQIINIFIETNVLNENNIKIKNNFIEYIANELEFITNELYFIDYFNEEDDFISYKNKDKILKITKEESLYEMIQLFKEYFVLNNYYSIQMVLFFLLNNRDYVNEIDATNSFNDFSINKIDILYKKTILFKNILQNGCFKKQKYNAFILFLHKKIDDKKDFLEKSLLNDIISA